MAHRLHGQRARQPNRLRLALVGGFSVAAVGCAMLNPYDHAPLKEPGQPDGMRLAGRAEEGLQFAEQARLGYYNNLKFTSVVRNSTAAAAVVLSGWGIYNALKPDGASATNAAPGETRRSVRIGATLATLYGLRQFFVNPNEETVYAEAYRALTCMMVQSAPLLLTEAVPTDPPVAIPTPQSPSSEFAHEPRIGGTSMGDLDRLRWGADRLEERILTVNLMLAKTQADADAIAGDDKDVRDSQSALRDQIKATTRALTYARHTLLDGQMLIWTVEGSGRDIRDRTANIVAVMNQQIQSKQQEFGKASDVLKNAHDITGGVLGIGAATAADQAVVSGTAPAGTTSVSSNNGSMSMAGIPAVWNGAAMSHETWSDSASFVKVASPASPSASEPSPTSAPTPAPAASKADAAQSKAAKAAPAKKTAPAKKAVAIKPKASELAGATLPELKAIRDKVDEAMKGITEREAKASKDKADAETDKLRKEIQKLKAGRDAGKMACNQTGCAKELAVATESLYAARRPVAAALLRFRSDVRKVAALPECAELAALRVTPNDVVRVKPGDKVSYIISQRDAGSPLAVLEGPTDEKTGAKLTYSPLMGTSLYRADIEIGAAMPDQTLRLVVSDSKVVVTQSLAIVSVAPPPPPKAASAPETAASDAKPAKPAAAAAPAAKT